MQLNQLTAFYNLNRIKKNNLISKNVKLKLFMGLEANMSSWEYTKN